MSCQPSSWSRELARVPSASNPALLAPETGSISQAPVCGEKWESRQPRRERRSRRRMPSRLCAAPTLSVAAEDRRESVVNDTKRRQIFLTAMRLNR